MKKTNLTSYCTTFSRLEIVSKWTITTGCKKKYHEDTHVEVVVVMLTLHNDKKHLATYKSSLCHSEKHDWLLLTCRQRPELYTVPKWKPFQVNYEGALFRPWHMLFCCPEFSQEKGLLSFPWTSLLFYLFERQSTSGFILHSTLLPSSGWGQQYESSLLLSSLKRGWGILLHR